MQADKPSNEKLKTFNPVLQRLQQEGEQVVRDVIGDAEYDASKVQDWVDVITHKIIDQLQTLNDDFKYIVSVIVMEKKSGGFHLFSTCYWDTEQDGTVTVRYENKNLHVIATIFGITLD